MKHFVCIIAFILSAMCLFSCGQSFDTGEDTTVAQTTEKVTEAVDTTDKTTDTQKQENDKTETTTDESNNMDQLTLPIDDNGMEFSFLSGAGAWRTELLLYPDGTFEGYYHDSEMGDYGEGYPNGSIYVCNFSGKFEITEKANEFSYKMKLTELNTEKENGEEWIEDGVRYIASHPYGITAWAYDSETDDKVLVQGEEFVFYLPDTSLEGLNENFLTWWPYRIKYYVDKDSSITTLKCYGILNVTTEAGFFSIDYAKE